MIAFPRSEPREGGWQKANRRTLDFTLFLPFLPFSFLFFLFLLFFFFYHPPASFPTEPGTNWLPEDPEVILT